MHDPYIATSLNPLRSIVVEACAGSGKTWLLVSRLVRLLLAGTRPGQILAITFTRKAAREIEQRLREFLGILATSQDDQVIAFLEERGLSSQEALSALPMARGLLEQVLQADPPIVVTTFHGWFAKLLAGAPLESALAGMSLEDNTFLLREAAWAQLSSECSKQFSQDAQVASCANSLLWLFKNIGAFNTRKLLHAFLDRRAEWQAWCMACGNESMAVARTIASFGEKTEKDIFELFFSATQCRDLFEYAQISRTNGKKGQSAAVCIDEVLHALKRNAPLEQVFESAREVLLTKTNAPRALTPLKAMPAQQAEKLKLLHKSLCETMLEALQALFDACNMQLNEHGLTVGVTLLKHFQNIKSARRVLDFTDLECQVDRLLSDERHAAFIQAKLDARYKHILLDEFQDTNPLQWRILRAWLDAYQSGRSGATPPTVFLVGDPKQSIYRFRRAEPRLFEAACTYFQEHYGAEKLTADLTRRNVQTVTDVVNAVFEAEPTFQGHFRPQKTTHQSPGYVALHALIPLKEKDKEKDKKTESLEDFRNPLENPSKTETDDRRAQESREIAQGIASMAGHWWIYDKHSKTERLAHYGDILILTRRKVVLNELESALCAAQIPFVSPGRGGLLATLEAQDVMALLRFLADPADNLALVHVLRTPVFDVSDTVLLTLSESAKPLWWTALRDFAQAQPQSIYAEIYALLESWVLAAHHLPAHDVLDRVFHSAQWIARYQARVPAPLWLSAHANIEALLELTLTVDAGRYPSLSRLVDELARLQEADAEESPDEGLIQTAQETAGRVRIMTVHGSKGLEAPIVWLMDADTNGIRCDGYTVALDWPAESDQPQHFSLLGRYSERGTTRQKIFETEAAAARREDANLLYVAMTRAEQVFIASGIETGKAEAPSPYARLLAALEHKLPPSQEGALVLGEALINRSLPLSSQGLPTQVPDNVQADPAKRMPQDLRIGSRCASSDDGANAGQAFGCALHAWLEAVTQGNPPPALSSEFSERVPATARKILSEPRLRGFFDPNVYLSAGNETLLVTKEGSLGRIDRWVDMGDVLWILDYKSGTVTASLMDAYHQQLATYAQAMKVIFPQKKLRGMLIFTGGELESVEVDFD